jgi:hypothetical protein
VRTIRAARFGHFAEVRCGDRRIGRTCGCIIAEVHLAGGLRLMVPSRDGPWTRADAAGDISAWCPRRECVMVLDGTSVRSWVDEQAAVHHKKLPLIVWAQRRPDGSFELVATTTKPPR